MGLIGPKLKDGRRNTAENIASWVINMNTHLIEYVTKTLVKKSVRKIQTRWSCCWHDEAYYFWWHKEAIQSTQW